MPNTKRHKYRSWYEGTEDSSSTSLSDHKAPRSCNGYDPELWERGEEWKPEEQLVEKEEKCYTIDMVLFGGILIMFILSLVLCWRWGIV